MQQTEMVALNSYSEQTMFTLLYNITNEKSWNMLVTFMLASVKRLLQWF